jgi:hypothetical protein
MARGPACGGYAEWKLAGLPILTRGLILEATEFLAPNRAAAINVMTSAAAIGLCARLQGTDGGEPRRRAVLGDLDRLGNEAIRRWPGIERLSPGTPLGLWPLPEHNDGPDAPSTPGGTVGSIGPLKS